MAKKRFSQQVTDLIVYVEGTKNAQKYLDEKLESTNPVIEDGANIVSIDGSDDEIEETGVDVQTTLVQQADGSIGIAVGKRWAGKE